MKLILRRSKNHWLASVHRGNGGISSMIASRFSKSLWFALGVFKGKNIIKAIRNF